jgi:hypothetical protein
MWQIVAPEIVQCVEASATTILAEMGKGFSTRFSKKMLKTGRIPLQDAREIKPPRLGGFHIDFGWN